MVNGKKSHKQSAIMAKLDSLRVQADASQV